MKIAETRIAIKANRHFFSFLSPFRVRQVNKHTIRNIYIFLQWKGIFLFDFHLFILNNV